MKKTTLILLSFAGAVLAASVTLNVCLFDQIKTDRLKSNAAVLKKGENPSRVSATSEKTDSTEFFLKSTEIYPSSSKLIYLHFNRYGIIPVPSGNGFLTVNPKVAFQVQPGNGEWDISGDFQPETVYEFTLKKGLRMEDGAELRQDASFRVKTPPLRPLVNFLSSGLLFPRKQKEWILPLELTNVSGISVTLLKLHENNLGVYAPETEDSLEHAREIGRKIIPVKIPRNRTVNYALELDSLIRDRNPGVYAIRLSSKEKEKENDYTPTRTLVVTDLAIQTVLDVLNKKAFVAVRSFENGAPVAGAEVTLVSKKHQTLARGVTDTEGIVLLDYASADDPADFARTLIAKKGNDISFYTDLYEKLHSLAEFGNAGAAFSTEPRAFLYTERGVYRAGETVHVSTFVRDSRLKVYPNAPCTIFLKDPKDNRILSRKVKTDGFGFASTVFELPADALSGNYTLFCSLDDSSGAEWGSASVLVADFVPDRIKTSLKPSAQTVGGKEKVSFEISADYYFGQNAGDAPYSFQVTAVPAPPPVHWQTWTVGDRDAFTAGRSFTGNGSLENGRAKLECPGFSERGGKAFSPVLLLASAQVREPGGRTVTASSSVTCHPFPFYIGIRKAEKNAVPKEAAIEWRLFPAEKDSVLPKGPREFRFRISRLEWIYVLKKDSDGQLGRDWELRRVLLPGEHVFRTDEADGVFRLPLENGHYEVEALCGKLRTRMDFFHWEGEGGVRSGNPSVLSFRTDKEVYKPGEIAKVTFASPFDGFAFVATGEKSLESMRSFAVRTGENTLEIPLPASVDTASCFSGITVVGNQRRSFGLLRFHMDRTARQLMVKLTAPEKAAPGEKIRVEAALTAPDGSPCEGVLQLFAVDEGILALTGYRTPDIFSFFFGDYSCHFQFSDVYGMLYPELRIDKNGKIGGDGGGYSPSAAKAKIQRNSNLNLPKSAVVVLPPVKMNGKTVLELSLPEHLGAMRIMAVASTSDRVGSAERPILLRDKIGVMPSGPVALAPGDEAELTFSLFNYELPEGPAAFKIMLPGGKEESFKVVLKKNGSSVFRLRFKAPETVGPLTIPCELVMGNISKKGELRMTVRPRNPPVTSTVFRVLRPGESWKLPDDSALEFLPGSLEKSLTLSPSPASVLKDAVSWLNSYPYGCLEQTTSAAFPFLSADMLAENGVISKEIAETAKRKGNAAAAKILSMMLYNGSFSVWPGSQDSWNGASIFAAHFLCASERWEKDPKRRCRAWLRKIADTSTLPRYDRAYACYVLALMEDKSFLVKIARNLLSGKENDFASFLASAALIRAGYSGEGALHMKRVLESEIWRAASDSSSFSDEASRAGMTLYLLMDSMPDSPAALKLAAFLQKKVRADGSGWGTTHANAWASLGLGAFARHYGAGGGSGTVTFGPDDVHTSAPGGTLHLTGLEKKSSGGVVENRGNVPVYVQWNVCGIPREIKPKPGAIRLRRVYLDQNGREVTSVSQGDLVTVKLQIGTAGAIRDVAVVDLLPGGLEIEDERFATRMARPEPKKTNHLLHIQHVEKRGDRLMLFADLLSSGKDEFTYQARAVTRGRFAAPPLCAEAMYSPDTGGIWVAGNVFEVK